MSGYAGRFGIAALIALGLALPGAADAQTFTDPRQAPADQYGTPASVGTPVTPTGTPDPSQRPAAPTIGIDDDSGREASAGRREASAGRGGARREGGGNKGGGGDGADARKERGADVAASLPFTGLNVATLILIGLLLGATGLGLRAVQARRARA